MLKNFEMILAALMLVILSKGCGLFDTRNPEAPNTIRSTYIPPTTPEIVIDNLSYSLLEKNSGNYSKCISQSQYSYVPDSKSQLTYFQIFLNWVSQSEKHYLDNLISRTNAASTSVLFLDNKILTLINSDSATFSAQYIVVFQHRLNFPKSAKGNLTLYLSTDENNLFDIKRWEDFRQHDTDYTWSEMKANFSN